MSDLSTAGAGQTGTRGPEVPPGRPYLWHALLLAVTGFTTTVVGARMQRDFEQNAPFMGLHEVWPLFAERTWHFWPVWDGLPFSVTLLAILLAHELGHFFAAGGHRLRTSLPYFLPAPVLIGTFGAFIRIQSPVFSRRTLFDVSLAGPVAGFLLALPALGVGLAYSKLLPGIGAEHQLRFGTPLLLRAAEWMVFPGVASEDIYLHPVARAAWVGLLATAWNLLPIGQLDGGHILYAVSPPLHRRAAWVVLGALAAMGYLFWDGWLVWAALLFFFRRHPPVYDPEPLGPERRRLAWVALALFALSFTVTPFDHRALF